MELFAHQKLISQSFEHYRITSVQAPRMNGKTFAAIDAAFRHGGTVAFVTYGNQVMRSAFDIASAHPKATRSRRSYGDETVEHVNGKIFFLAYTKTGTRGLTLDGIILDDADRVGEDIFANYYPSLFKTSAKGHILSLGTLPEGLAGHLANVADRKLHWRGLAEEDANPGLGTIIRPESLQMASKILPQEIYDREHLGITPEIREELEKQHVSSLIQAQLYAGHPKAA